MARLIGLLSCATVASLALALGMGSAAMAAEGCADATIAPREANLERARESTLCLLNVERAKHDLAPLRHNSQLHKAAQAYSAKMVRDRFFAHVCPEGSTLSSRIRRSTKYLGGSVRDWSLGENLGWGSGSLATPKSIVRAWMRSSTHRDAILDDGFRDVGIGVAMGAPVSVPGRAATYTTQFGYRVTG